MPGRQVTIPAGFFFSAVAGRSNSRYTLLVKEEEKKKDIRPPPPSLKKGGEENPSARESAPLPFEKRESPNWTAWQLAWELGYTIAIPIVALALLGRWADRAWSTAPWLFLLGVVLSVIISSFLVYRKTKDILG